MRKIIICLTLYLTFFGTNLAQTFTLKSDELGGQATNKELFNGFGCSGLNISPQLCWENPPADTKSFAITIHDPDAPTGSGWWHWLVYDISKETLNIPANAGNPELNLLPKGAIQSITDFGKLGYGGPCPPKGHGFHQYIITVYALKTEKLNLDAMSNAALVGYTINSNLIEKASMIFYCKRD